MGKLALIPTPIGNLEDITLRAIRYLKECDLVLAEDTRTSARLFQEYGISTPVASFHKFNEHTTTQRLVDDLLAGRSIALISDAGTPGISDPGYLLVKECIEKGVKVEALPGATALIPALVASGLPSDRFLFEGFLPHKKGRKSRIEALKERDVTTIFYESPNRITKLLEQILTLLGDQRQVVIARELTKMYEEYLRGTASELLAHFEHNPPLGEMVVLIAPADKPERVHRNKYKDDSKSEE